MVEVWWRIGLKTLHTRGGIILLQPMGNVGGYYWHYGVWKLVWFVPLKGLEDYSILQALGHNQEVG